jgi:hypothetical protein
MDAKQLWEREKYVALHAQSTRFRVIKYLVLVALLLGIFFWAGWSGIGIFFLITTPLSFLVHFFYRWKTKSWTQSWGGYKKLDLPN